jgi:hypothetical protein
LQPWQTNRYENGTLTIPALGIFEVITGQGSERVWQFNNYLNYVIVPGTVPTNAVNLEAQLRDDDDRLRAELQLPSLPLDTFSTNIISGKQPVLSSHRIRGVAEVYLPAFIDVVDANAAGWNTGRTIPFSVNRDVFYPLTMAGVFDDAKNLTDSPIFWAHTVTIGYQPDFPEDRDNNEESALQGVTPENPVTSGAFGYTAIYEETIRDNAYEIYTANRYVPANYSGFERDYYYLLFGTIAHEVGHAPGKLGEGSDHGEGQLMKVEGNQITSDFSPATLRRFRRSSSWTGGAP